MPGSSSATWKFRGTKLGRILVLMPQLWLARVTCFAFSSEPRHWRGQQAVELDHQSRAKTSFLGWQVCMQHKQFGMFRQHLHYIHYLHAIIYVDILINLTGPVSWATVHLDILDCLGCHVHLDQSRNRCSQVTHAKEGEEERGVFMLVPASVGSCVSAWSGAGTHSFPQQTNRN